jgi:hypothetical protein
MNHVGGGADPHECWQEDGFWPGRVSADLSDLQVWGCELALSYYHSGDVVQFLMFISGRLLPEMVEGVKILDCQQCAQVAQEMLAKFGKTFPRVDRDRRDFVDRHETWFDQFNSRLWTAWESDEFERKSSAYYKEYCLRRDIPPWGQSSHPDE